MDDNNIIITYFMIYNNKLLNYFFCFSGTCSQSSINVHIVYASKRKCL